MKNRLINEQIRESQMLVIDLDGTNLGVMNRAEALAKAEDEGYDLVLMVPKMPNKNSPAICKIADYGKMMYEEKTKERQARKNQTVVKVKEIKVRPQISENDLKWMAKNATNWLEDNNQIKFKVRAYGRMGTKTEQITGIFDKFMELIGPIGKVQTPLKKITPVLYEATIVKNK